METSSIQQDKTAKAEKKKLATCRKRSNELDNIIRKLYEDNISGKLTDKRFEKLSGEYEREQEELEQTIERLQTEIDSFEVQTINTDKFLELVSRYTDFEELTTTMLNEFIEKVVVHEREKGYRYSTTQRVDIYFNFVGMVELPEMESNTEPDDGFQEKHVSKKAAKMYAPLAEYLECQIGSSISLTLAEMEKIIDMKLCKTAYEHRSFWYPNKNRALACVIYNTGYDIEKIDLENQIIILKKPETMLTLKEKEAI